VRPQPAPSVRARQVISATGRAGAMDDHTGFAPRFLAPGVSRR
jgi:hypothetical protein